MFLLSVYSLFKNRPNIRNVISSITKYYSFYLLYFIIDLLAISYSENISFGFKDLESKIFFLTVPIIFLSYNFDKNLIDKCLKSFVFGTFLLLIIHFIYAFQYFLKYNEIPLYIYFSIFMHSTYLSIYLLVSIIIIKEFIKHTSKKIKFINYLMIIMCSIGITLSDSKAGILSLILLSVYYLILFISKQKRYIQIFTIFLITIISLFGLKKIEKTRFSELNKSFHLEKQKEYTGNYNSTEIRIIIWRSVNQLILKNTLFGTGTGDFKDELKDEFHKINFIDGIHNNYNSHNQFLQIIATYGFLLGGSLIIVLGLSIFVNLKNQHPILIIFNLLMVFNFLFESILESKAGIEIFTLFNILLSSKIIPPKYSNTDYSVI